jgi:uncharacterized protein YabE (DUF348 family)
MSLKTVIAEGKPGRRVKTLPVEHLLDSEYRTQLVAEQEILESALRTDKDRL